MFYRKSWNFHAFLSKLGKCQIYESARAFLFFLVSWVVGRYPQHYLLLESVSPPSA